MFLKNRNIIFKMKISKVTDYAALMSVLFSNCNNRRMTLVHAEILLSFMQWVEEYLVALKDFDYSLGYKQPITSKGK